MKVWARIFNSVAKMDLLNRYTPPFGFLLRSKPEGLVFHLRIWFGKYLEVDLTGSLILPYIRYAWVFQ